MPAPPPFPPYPSRAESTVGEDLCGSRMSRLAPGWRFMPQPQVQPAASDERCGRGGTDRVPICCSQSSPSIFVCGGGVETSKGSSFSKLLTTIHYDPSVSVPLLFSPWIQFRCLFFKKKTHCSKSSKRAGLALCLQPMGLFLSFPR